MDSVHEVDLPPWPGRWAKLFGRWIDETQCNDLANSTKALKQILEESLRLLAELDSLGPVEQRHHKDLISISHIRVYETFKLFEDHALPSPWILCKGIDPMGEFRVLRNHFAHNYRIREAEECQFYGNKWSYLQKQYPEALLYVDVFFKEVTRLQQEQNVWKVNSKADTSSEEKDVEEKQEVDMTELGWDEEIAGPTPPQLWSDEAEPTPSDESPSAPSDTSFQKDSKPRRRSLALRRKISKLTKRKSEPEDDSSATEYENSKESGFVRILHGCYNHSTRVKRKCDKLAERIGEWKNQESTDGWEPEWDLPQSEEAGKPSEERINQV
jgi:hypothetical protein